MDSSKKSLINKPINPQIDILKKMIEVDKQFNQKFKDIINKKNNV